MSMSMTLNDEATARAVETLERERFAVMAAGRFDALEALLADGLTYHHSGGQADTKASWLASLRSGQTIFRAIEPGDLLVRVFGRTAVITGTVTMHVTVNGEPQRNPIRYTDVWIDRGDGRWLMTAWQSTRLP